MADGLILGVKILDFLWLVVCFCCVLDNGKRHSSRTADLIRENGKEKKKEFERGGMNSQSHWFPADCTMERGGLVMHRVARLYTAAALGRAVQ